MSKTDVSEEKEGRYKNTYEVFNDIGQLIFNEEISMVIEAVKKDCKLDIWKLYCDLKTNPALDFETWYGEFIKEKQ